MNDIAKNIKKFRQEKDWTQERLAEELHVTRQAVSSWETGKSEPDMETLERISAALQVELLELIYGKKQRDGYARFQKKAVIWVIVLGVLAAFTLFNALVLIPWANAYRSTHYVSWPSALCRFVIPAIGLTAIGMLVPAVVSLWRDVQPTGRMRTVLRIAAIVLLLPVVYWVIAMCFYIAEKEVPLGKVFGFLIMDPSLFRMHLVSYYLPLLGGLILYPAFVRLKKTCREGQEQAPGAKG